MKRQKRNGQDRAFSHGYKAAILGKSMQACPHQNEPMRFQWISGWREGRDAHWQGQTGVAGLHRGRLI